MKLHKLHKLHYNNKINYYYSNSVAMHRSKSGLYCARLCRNTYYKKKILVLYNIVHLVTELVRSPQKKEGSWICKWTARHLNSMVFTIVIWIILSKQTSHASPPPLPHQ